MKDKTVLDKVRETFANCKIGTKFTCQEIIKKVTDKFDVEIGSIIPSDYCYNLSNKGIPFENYLHLFEYEKRNSYIYRGENYNYTGKVDSKSSSIIGEWKDGTFYKK